MKKEKSGRSDAANTENRRNTLKTLISGAGMAVAGSQTLPDRWLKPVVSSIVLPAHAETSPPAPAGPAFECQIGEVSVAPTAESSEFNISAEATTEAVGQPAVFILRNSGTELNGGTEDLAFPAMVEGSAVFIESGFSTEASAELQLDLDIGDDTEVDCGTTVEVNIE
ncbi:MAG: hypothetical protein U5R46_13935 [Gammaproteobacteria bacterium]|nr:hypothetical protein [Gammaproteobacteria bacterium]